MNAGEFYYMSISPCLAVVLRGQMAKQKYRSNRNAVPITQ